MWFYLLQPGDYVVMQLNLEVMPDRFSFDGGSTVINATVGGLDPETAQNGDWEWDNINKKVDFVGKNFSVCVCKQLSDGLISI